MPEVLRITRTMGSVQRNKRIK